MTYQHDSNSKNACSQDFSLDSVPMVSHLGALWERRVSRYFPLECIHPEGSFSRLDEADSCIPGSLVYCQNLNYLRKANSNDNVSVIVTTPELAREPITPSKSVVSVKDPRMTFFQLYTELMPLEFPLDRLSGKIGRDCIIHPSAVISQHCKIGDRVEIGPNAVIGDNVEICDDVFIDANVVLGAEGLMTLRNEDGSLLRIKHHGGVYIGRGTMIYAGAVIVRSLFASPTTIGKNVQIGVLTNIGHGARIGDMTVVSGNSVIAGRVTVGKNVWIGAASSVAQGLFIGDRTQIKMGSVVVANTIDGAVISGNFALPHTITARNHSRMLRNAEI